MAAPLKFSLFLCELSWDDLDVNKQLPGVKFSSCFGVCQNVDKLGIKCLMPRGCNKLQVSNHDNETLFNINSFDYFYFYSQSTIHIKRASP